MDLLIQVLIDLVRVIFFRETPQQRETRYLVFLLFMIFIVIMAIIAVVAVYVNG